MRGAAAGFTRRRHLREHAYSPDELLIPYMTKTIFHTTGFGGAEWLNQDDHPWPKKKVFFLGDFHQCRDVYQSGQAADSARFFQYLSSISVQ